MNAPVSVPADQRALALITEYLRLKDHVSAETKRFDDFIEPFKTRQQAIGDELLSLMNELGTNNFATDAGTAYKSTLLNVKLADRDAFLDHCMDQWDDGGSDMLLVQAQKDAVKGYLEAHKANPPGVETSQFTRVNVRKS
jgi:hypothetical protein